MILRTKLVDANIIVRQPGARMSPVRLLFPLLGKISSFLVGIGLPCLKLGQTLLPMVVGLQLWERKSDTRTIGKEVIPTRIFPKNHHFVEFHHILTTLGRKVLLNFANTSQVFLSGFYYNRCTLPPKRNSWLVQLEF